MTMDSLIARFIGETRYEDLTGKARLAAKHHILHTLGTALAGSSAPGIGEVLALSEDAGGRPESSVLVYGTKVPAISAAFVNSTMAHALDYCMNDDRTYYKSSVTVIPAALAVAEQIKAVTGKDFLTAVAVGIELGVRIALAINPKPPHARSPMIGGFASVATAARLLKLEAEEILDALGIVYCQVCSSGGSTSSPALNKRLLAGLAARAGVFSGLLAKKGFKSSRHTLNGPKGYFVAYHGVEGDIQNVTANLGKEWEFVQVGPKGYPCCRVLHAPIDATLALVKEEDIRPEEVEEVSVFGSRSNLFMSPEAVTVESVEKRRHPQGMVDAQFSYPWAVATAIVKRSVFIEDFTEAALGNQDVHKISDKVSLYARRALEDTGMMLTPAVVEIATTGRGAFSKRIDFPKGNPLNPVTIEETRENFRRCATYAARPLASRNIDKAVEIVDHLEELDDVGRLTALLS